MKVGDLVTALVNNGQPGGLRVTGRIERVLDDGKVVEVATQFSYLMRLDIQEAQVTLVESPDASNQ